jgi:hypothetical protein
LAQNDDKQSGLPCYELAGAHVNVRSNACMS